MRRLIVAAVLGFSPLAIAQATIPSTRPAAATPVTLHVTAVPAPEALAALGNAAGIEILPLPSDLWEHGTAAEVTLHAEGKPFWTALLDVCRQAGVWPHVSNGTVRVMTHPDLRLAGPGHVSGPILFTATRVAHHSSWSSPRGVKREFAVEMTAFAEPGLRIVRSDDVPLVTQAADEKGNSLVPRGKADLSTTPAVKRSDFNVVVPLEFPENPGATIKTLKGTMGFVVQSDFQTLELADVAGVDNLKRDVAGVSLNFIACRKVGKTYELEVGVRPSEQSKWSLARQMLEQAPRLTDENGEVLQEMLADTQVVNKAIRHVIQYRATGKTPAKLSWKLPTATVPIQATFEFHDLPIP